MLNFISFLLRISFSDCFSISSNFIGRFVLLEMFLWLLTRHVSAINVYDNVYKRNAAYEELV